MKINIWNIVLLIGLVIAAGGFVERLWAGKKLSDANEQLNKQLMQANLDIGRAATQFGNAQDYINQLEVKQKEEIKKREAVLHSYGELEARYHHLQKNLKIKSKIITKEIEVEVPCAEFKRGQYYLGLSPTILQPIDNMQGEYHDNRINLFTFLDLETNPEEWTFNYELNLRLAGQFIETELPSGAINHYATLWEVDKKGNKVGEYLKIENFNVVVNKPNESQMFWWNPKIDIAGIVGIAGVPNIQPLLGASIGLSFSGYGKTVNDLDWRFFRLSLDLTNETVGIGVTPALWNVGTVLPVVSNLWLGLHVDYLIPQGWGVGLILGAVL